jgi:3-methyl-2-oxobutanoate hydroxymethyltransferase
MALPYGSFQASNEDAVRNAVRLVKAGAQTIKAQVDLPLLDRAKAIIGTGIPFQGHVGLMPQYYHQRGGMIVYGRTAREARHIYELCLRLQDLGASAIEMECVPALVAEAIARRLTIPVLGIGSGLHTDGQIIVLVDVLGLQQTLELKTVKKYANLWPLAVEALKQCANEVRTGQFPEECHTFSIKPEEYEQFMESLKD